MLVVGGVLSQPFLIGVEAVANQAADTATALVALTLPAGAIAGALYPRPVPTGARYPYRVP